MTRIGRIGADFLVWCGEKEPAWGQTGTDFLVWCVVKDLPGGRLKWIFLWVG